MTLLGAERRSPFALAFEVGVAGGNRPAEVGVGGRRSRLQQGGGVLPLAGHLNRATEAYAAWVRTESVAEFTARMKRLQALACPTEDDVGFFNEQMETAFQHGMKYREGLEFTIRMRHGGAD